MSLSSVSKFVAHIPNASYMGDLCSSTRILSSMGSGTKILEVLCLGYRREQFRLSLTFLLLCYHSVSLGCSVDAHER